MSDRTARPSVLTKQVTQPPLAPNAWLRYDAVERFVLRHRPSSIVEVGAGAGAMGARLQTHARYSAVEPDPVSRDSAADRLGGADSVVARIEDLHGQKFDLLCAFEVLEHIEDDASALAEWQRLVAPGGWMLFSVPAHQHRFSDADVAAGHVRRYDPCDFRNLLAGAGLRSISVETYGFPLGHVLERARNHLARRAALEDVPIEERTAASARFHQPTAKQALFTRLGSAPFRRLQRVFQRTDWGVGLLGYGQLARAPE